MLCTFRSLYLCNIGCPADRGVTQRDTPTNQATVPGSLTQEDAADPGALSRETLKHRRVPMGHSPSLVLEELFQSRVPRCFSPKGTRIPREVSRLRAPKRPQDQARGSRPRRECAASPPHLRGPKPSPAKGRFRTPEFAISGGVAPFGSHSSLAVTEKDTMVFSSSANRYA